MVEYIVRFCGIIPENDNFKKACRDISRSYRFTGEDTRIRYVIFSQFPHERHQERGVTYITFRSIIEFLVSIRGQSWRDAKLGVASQHQQWPPFVCEIFNIANNASGSLEEKMANVEKLLGFDSKKG